MQSLTAIHIQFNLFEAGIQKEDQTLVFKTDYRYKPVESIAVLNTFDLH